MRCNYCFYSDTLKCRSRPGKVLMTLPDLETVVQKTLEASDGGCSFVFQGGEPMLAGQDFYRALLKFEEKHNSKGQHIENSIQTNGTLMTRKWAEFFAENGFLVGLSLDGIRTTNDRNRVFPDGSGSFDKIIAASELLKKAGVGYNILTVVTARVAVNITAIYEFYRESGFEFQQYIPCLDPYGAPRGGEDYSLLPMVFGRFLCDLFDLWYADIQEGRDIYIRYFEELFGVASRMAQPGCGMCGVCPPQYVVEADGSVYPCDFYALEKHCLGSLVSESFAALEKRRVTGSFIAESRGVSARCAGCKYYIFCRGGCRRDRDFFDGKADSANYYCQSYKMFFEHAMPRLQRLIKSNGGR